MKLLYQLLKQDAESRDGVIVTTSVLGILTNIVLSLVKIAIGIAASSIAVISEGINNASDVATAVIAIVGTKLSQKHPTEKHPFGYGRIEYLTSLVISVLILITGVEVLKSSIELIFNPTRLRISYVTLVVVAISAVVKLLLGTYTMKEGKRVDAKSLIAVGKDALNDCIVSIVTIISAVTFLMFHISIDAFAGIFTSVFIIKAGVEILKETIDDLLGQSDNKALANEIYQLIRKEPIVINAADMMLHNYGPDSYSGSVNLEIDHSKTVGEVYASIHALQLKIMQEYDITMVFGMYAVDYDHEGVREMRRYIADYVRNHEFVNSYHALYLDPDNRDIYCDLIADYKLRDWDELRNDFTEYMKKEYPDQKLRLVIETNYV